MTFWTYLLRCADGSFYCGHTDNLDARIGQHRIGMAAAHTKHRRPVTLVWSQDFSTRLEALEAERRIKGWWRAKKDALMRGDWTGLSSLARNRQGAGHPSTGSGRTEAGGICSHPVRAEPVEARPPIAIKADPHP